MPLTLLFFFASMGLGLAIMEAVKIVLPSYIKIFFAIILGVIVNILVIFGISQVFGLNITNVLIATSLTFFPSLIFLTKRPGAFEIFGKLEVKKNPFIVGSLLVLGIFIVVFFFKSIYVNENGIIAGNRLVWTDWPVHIAIISSFVHGNNFPPQNPLYAGQTISYPFFADFLSAVLQVLGASLKTSLIIPGIILGISVIVLIYFLGIILTGSKKTAIVGLFIGIFWGGLGFLYFLQDLLTSSNFWQTLLFPPHEYTFYGEKNLWFFSFLYSELLPQRGFLFGLPMFLLGLIFLILGISRNKNSYLLASGCLVAIMPFFHMHSYLSFLFLISVLIPLTILTDFIQYGLAKAKSHLAAIIFCFLLPIVTLGLIQLPLFISLNLSQTVGLNWGWMKGHENIFLFWFKNTGFFWPLFIFAIFKIKLAPVARNVLIASVILFILPNIIRFAPWPYDNLKIMTYWYLIGAFFVAESLLYFYKKNDLGKIIATVLFITLIISGVIEVTRIFNTQKTKINLWSRNDIELADVIIAKTEPRSLILTAAIHDHPVTALAGRKIIIGFPGNAWSWGLADWSQRETDVHTMFKGGPSFLFNKYKVDYVLISPRERNFEPRLNEDYFAKNFTFVSGGPDYKLYQIR
ncbi:hypothetical protein A3B52_02815 [Candidatus Curtissbacteria bacterium RIFCSPLOWO2_01_FULL_41_28]|uniref:Glycosyltransferase RgtA/B/C/D-like domain-containing protein n=1 Tax=Candidatus Curtissbacteria bacterium RIFOXYA1_FULL_41_14 TaxID=1797737 RepID=A0A1F5HCC4_9BACT|nr:MAG: hypothetical protein UU00_C0002G0005 [Microgenomates group bacterium GW2011_GWC1_40_35]KKS02358.1 MAG: hypothetical protein UU53_C0002G0083 [Candidatus Curtissbacteria bacterium GW2011_GWC2_41_21]OGD79513.1 MAG: hypothetical protein A2683_02365 [Candidatus Curtissbacteria bacterium RIFCSPHIGHO2_01_FULL_34_40]OGD91481.1 MAG: hypothetical protein A3E14_00415 [Candidatus Curtissbacteria bacterium RIFCSPHIGHO2_12_FULL_41_13]OGD95474.1 MAG: hypothetical protein A3B52_02815 [Candidatus Curtis